MGDVKGNFEFILRGTDSLAYKWVNEVRGTGALENGINLWALADYFYKTLHLNKVFSDLYPDYNKFTSELKNLNNFDNDKIITFTEKVKIPVTHRIVDIAKGSANNFTQIREKIESEETLLKKKFNELLSKDEISEFLINIYHVFYDNRSKEGVTGKKYKEIIDHPYLYFGSNTKLSFLVPTSIIMKATTSTTVEENKEIKLEENKTKPEVDKTYIVKSKVKYFIVHDTGSSGGEKLSRYSTGYSGVTHGFIDTEGTFLKTTDFNKDAYGTKMDAFKGKGIGEMIHIELILTTSLKPTDKQYNQLATIYAGIYNANKNKKLIIVPHREIDRGVTGYYKKGKWVKSAGHNDPRNFDFNKLYKTIKDNHKITITAGTDGITQDRYEYENQSDMDVNWPPKLKGKPTRS